MTLTDRFLLHSIAGPARIDLPHNSLGLADCVIELSGVPSRVAILCPEQTDRA